MLLALGADIYIVAMLEPRFDVVSIPTVGSKCNPKSEDSFGLIWYVLLLSRLPRENFD